MTLARASAVGANNADIYALPAEIREASVPQSERWEAECGWH